MGVRGREGRKVQRRCAGLQGMRPMYQRHLTDGPRIPTELDRKQHQSKTVDLPWQYSDITTLPQADLSDAKIIVTGTRKSTGKKYGMPQWNCARGGTFSIPCDSQERCRAKKGERTSEHKSIRRPQIHQVSPVHQLPSIALIASCVTPHKNHI